MYFMLAELDSRRSLYIASLGHMLRSVPVHTYACTVLASFYPRVQMHRQVPCRNSLSLWQT